MGGAYIGAKDYSAYGLGDDPKNILILCYAEVLLMNAEAANEMGDGGTALADLELIRARARNGNAAGLTPMASPTTTRL